MGNDLPAVSLVIASYRRQDMLRETIGDVLAQNYGPFQVIVVDQSENPVEGLDPGVEVMHLERPHLPHARNEGIHAARGEVVIFTDDDVAMPATFVQAHATCYADPSVGAVAGRVITLPNAPRPLLEAPSPTGSDFDRAEPGAANVPRGCNMSFRKTALLDAGLFDEGYSSLAWSEEEDMAFGVRRLGWRMVYEPRAWLIHRHSPQGGLRTTSQVPFDRPEFYRDRTYFALKNVGGVDFWRVLWDLYRHTLPPRARSARVLTRQVAWGRGSIGGLSQFLANGKRTKRLPYRLPK